MDNFDQSCRCVIPWVIAMQIVSFPTAYGIEPSEILPTPVLLAQTTDELSPERIRTAAQHLREFRALLADPDSNTRLAAMNQMLNSSDPAMRELAFSSGFASVDENMRALALRSRILAIKSLFVEPQKVDDAWLKFSKDIPTFHITKVDPQTGNISGIAGGYEALGGVAGQEFHFSTYLFRVSLRLTDGAIMLGTLSSGDKVFQVKLAVQ